MILFAVTIEAPPPALDIPQPVYMEESTNDEAPTQAFLPTVQPEVYVSENPEWPLPQWQPYEAPKRYKFFEKLKEVLFYAVCWPCACGFGTCMYLADSDESDSKCGNCGKALLCCVCSPCICMVWGGSSCMQKIQECLK